MADSFISELSIDGFPPVFPQGCNELCLSRLEMVILTPRSRIVAFDFGNHLPTSRFKRYTALRSKRIGNYSTPPHREPDFSASTIQHGVRILRGFWTKTYTQYFSGESIH